MKLIVHSIGVLVVTGALSFAIAPVLSLAHPTDPLNRPPSSGVTPALEQQDPLSQIDTTTRSVLANILTPTQLMQLEQALASNTGISRTTLIALHLSPAQQTELMKILLSPQPPNDVLTPNQIEQMRRSLPFHP